VDVVHEERALAEGRQRAIHCGAVELGAQDYAVKGKLSGEALARTLRYAVLRHNKQEIPGEAAAARALGVVGAKGGVGTTTFACHLALEWRRQTGQRILLMDFDEDSASSAFLLKSNSRYSILDASTGLHRLDANLWKSMVWSRDGLDLIQPQGYIRLGDRRQRRRRAVVELEAARTLVEVRGRSGGRR
jgi:hypothetical protein